jgi:hypothetical protein
VSNEPIPINVEEARAKAAQCRVDAKRVTRPEHKTMLEHMAETWERIAKSLQNGH